MSNNYDVRVWEIRPRKNKDGKVTSYIVRWRVGTARFYKTFKVRAQADSFRSDLVSAQRKGESFHAKSGFPSSMRDKTANDLTWYEFTCRYVDMKWPESSATSRQSIAEALIRVIPVFVPIKDSGPGAMAIRSALRQWGYNTEYRDSEVMPAAMRDALDWCAKNSAAVNTVTDPDTLREVQRAATRRLDGKPFAPSVASKTRAVLSNLLDYAVELELIGENPLHGAKWASMPKGGRSKKVDKRAVPNPVQARTLLAAVRRTRESGAQLEAAYACMYFAGLRPEEVVALNKRHLSLPAPTWDAQCETYVYDWGTLHLDNATPHVGSRWTDSGTPRDRRQLKARAVGEGRPVPCPPELTALLQQHISKYGFGREGRVFVGAKGGEVPAVTFQRVWRDARKYALAKEARVTPLARRPYDLRHAAVSTWLSGGVDPARVAEWAGHSVSVLYEVYAAYLDGGDALARQQVQRALGHKV